MSTTQSNSTTVLLRGTIMHLSRHKGAADFLASQKQKDNLATAIFTTFASGNDGIGASLASMSDITVESADYLAFEIDGKNVEVCVWASNFFEGDDVLVVAEFIENKWKGFAIHRPSDGLTAVYPHCTRGRYAHLKATAVWAFIIASISYVIMMILMYFASSGWEDYIDFAKMAIPAVYGMTALFALRGAWKFKKIVLMAERIFSTLNWPNPKWVDLRSGVKRKKREGDPPSFGVSLFRYDSNR